MDILIVGRNPAGGEALAAALAGRSVQTWVAGDIRAALDICRRVAVDVLIVDLELGALRGDELAARIAHCSPKIKCILICDGELNGAPVCHPFDVVLRRPVDIDTLEAVIRRWGNAA